MALINTGLTEAGVRSEFMQRYDAATTYFQEPIPKPLVENVV